MREGFDKEIDSLLRRTARASTGVRGNGAGEPKSDSHLDADELAAFAEGALPEAARMNAVSHLADCGECRAHAVNLTRAAGVEAELDKRALAAAASPASSSKARESSPKRGWLATLFAPRTLGYVAPVLVLCLVGAVSFIALRSRKGDLANLERSDAGSRPAAATQANAQLTTGTLGNANSSSNANTASPAPSASEPLVNDRDSAGLTVPKPENKDVREDAPDGSAAGGAAATEEKAPGRDTEGAAPPPPPPSAAKEAKEADDAKTAAQPPAEMTKSAPVDTPPASKSGEHMKAGPPPSAQNTDELASNSASQTEQQKRGAQPRGMEPQSPDGSRNRSGINNSASGGAFGAARNEREARQQRDSPARRGDSDRDAASESGRSNAVEESRSAAGHRFRREGGAWVDVNYKSSMPSTGVRRGTDQYRALVADIPEIGRVAEQIGGEVTVVVRGRAYRIR